MIKHYLVLVVAVMFLQGCSESVETSDEVKQTLKIAEKAATSECVISSPAEPLACTMQHDPVCGCDGKSYGNACTARGAGVPHSTPGACGEKGRD